MIIPFYKFHGIGNDFIIIENNNLPADRSKLAIDLCDRHFGIGGDGIIIPTVIDDTTYKMKIINSDGSEAEMCGNGMRCLALYIYKYINPVKSMKVSTLAGNIYPQIFDENGEILVKLDMGEPRLIPSEIPVTGFSGDKVVNSSIKVNDKNWNITTVSMGNPHCVIFIPDLNDIDVVKDGRSIETDNHFPRKTNVEFVQVLNRKHIKVDVWERGAGVTLACGTGSCASVVAGVLNNVCERETKVSLPGGDLDILWNEENNHVYLTGPAKEVFHGEIEY